MIKQISHIGVAVDNLKEASDFFRENFGLSVSEKEDFGELIFSFIPFNQGSDLELLQSTTPDGTMARFIEKKGQGVHHIAFEVENIYSEIERLKKEGFKMIHEEPKKGADNKLIAFLHPKSTNGVLIELCQDIVK